MREPTGGDSLVASAPADGRLKVTRGRFRYLNQPPEKLPTLTLTDRERRHAIKTGQLQPTPADEAAYERAEAKRQRRAAKHARLALADISIDAIADGAGPIMREHYDHNTHQVVRRAV